MARLSPLQISALVHLSFVAFASIWFWWEHGQKKTQNINIDVYESPQVASPKATIVTNPTKPPPSPPQEEKRAVFGIQKKSLNTTSEDAGAEVKLGNTVTKENDTLQLNANDAEALPIPADEFLVTQMPKIRREVRAKYPPDAKKAGITGAVVLEILIDQKGAVRDTRLISGPGAGLNEAAMDAIKQFEFSPAQIKDQAVAVRVRYTYRFVLEAM